MSSSHVEQGIQAALSDVLDTAQDNVPTATASSSGDGDGDVDPVIVARDKALTLTHIAQLVGILGADATKTKQLKQRTAITITFEHSRRFVRAENFQGAPKTLVVFSRDSSNGHDLATMLFHNIIWAIRYMNAMPNIAFNRIIAQHIRHRSSQLAIPDQAYGTVVQVWAPFLNSIATIPNHTPDVHFLVRGWDGISTHPTGLRHFIRRFGSGHNCNGTLNFTFVFFQPRESTHAQLQHLFGHPQAPNPPEPADRWWPPPPLGSAGRALEDAMHARVHLPFTHQTYLNTLDIANVHMPLPNSRYNNSTLTLLYVLDFIDKAKTAGGAQQNQNQNNPLYNQGRNWVPW